MQHVRLVLMLLVGLNAHAAAPPLLAEKETVALINEVNGDVAKGNLEKIVQFHRQRGSREFHLAAQVIADAARSYGLSDVAILKFPADGKIFYGTQRSRPAWDAQSAELGEVKDGNIIPLANYADIPVVLAQDSESADVVAQLIDVASGTKDSDYEGKAIKGKIVLTSVRAGRIQDLAIGKYGAVGIVSYDQNQKTAWSGDNEDQIRWGHLDTFSAHKTFAFMVSLNIAKKLKSRLANNEIIQLQAKVKAGQHPGFYEVVTASIPGSDAALKNEEIAFSCHLDHQKPGANDNASGCITILEVARTLQKLINTGVIARPARTIRFIWPPEVEGTVTLLNAKSEFAQRIKAVIHMDMVGGGVETKAVFHVTGGPASLPSAIHEVAWDFAQWVNKQSYEYAANGQSAYPMIASRGAKDPLRAEKTPFSLGSDQEVYQDSSFSIPAIYFNDWPDRFIHTNLDAASNIDATKLQRVAFIGAASGYFLAGNKSFRFKEPVTNSAPPSVQCQGEQGSLVFTRNKMIKGPMQVFGYDYFADHANKLSIATPKLLEYQGERADGELFAYEALNFVDGQRNVQQICNALSEEFGSVPLNHVLEYLQALQKMNVLLLRSS